MNGPGRTKILIIAEQDWREHLDVIVDSIAGLGGIACVNATAVLYEGNRSPLAHAIGERLAALRPPPNVDEMATLPTTPIANARALSDFLGRKAVRAQAVLGADQIIADLGDGYAPLRPDRARVGSARRGHHRRRVASPLRVGGGPVTRGRPLSSISWSPSQPSPTSTGRRSHSAAPRIPHDGYLADFLMRNKGFTRT